MTEPPREHPSTYIVQDRNRDEMKRLTIQDTLLTAGMGGPLPELVDPESAQRILDVGCGTGGWLMETARTYPLIHRLFGTDVSEKMLAHARAQAEAQHLHERVEFQAADALRALPFPDGFFDLVNQRLGASWLRTWEWTKILLEYRRVLRPGGMVRITETNGLIESTSPALTRLGDLSLEVFHRSGRLFSPTPDGITGHLERLIRQHCFEHIQTRVHTIVLRAGTFECQNFYDDVKLAYRLILPFFHKWTNVPHDYQDTYQQALNEMGQPDFEATWTLLTVLGTKPVEDMLVLMRGLP